MVVKISDNHVTHNMAVLWVGDFVVVLTLKMNVERIGDWMQD